MLHQHDGHVALFAQIFDGAADVFDDGGLDALCGLIQHEEPWPRHQRAADGELLLLAARQIAAAPPEHVLQHGEEIEDFIGHEALAARQGRVACFQILAHGEQREYFAALRHIGDAAFGALMGREFGYIRAVPHDAARRDALMADDGAHERGLAHAIAPEHAGDATGLGLETDGAQGLRSAVEKIDGLNGQHVSVPDRLR